MGYSATEMVDLLRLIGGLLVGLFRSHAAREAEIIFLRQQLLPEPVRPSASEAAQSRSADLRLALPAVPLPSENRNHLQARDTAALASQRLASLLALEVTTPGGAALSTRRHPQSGAAAQPREPSLGCAAHSWRAAETGYRGRPVDGRQIYDPASWPTVPGLVDVPAQSRRSDASHGHPRSAHHASLTNLRLVYVELPSSATTGRAGDAPQRPTGYPIPSQPLGRCSGFLGVADGASA
jgi:hypothetical protein